ncbi:MAG: Short-chain dehydrogenase [Burkholderia sp.]|jgi:short-subunit dehydrogenase
MANVFITGASSGLGAALARRYAARGDTVGLVGRHPGRLQAVADTLPGDRARIHVLPADVTKRGEILSAAAEFEHLTGGADIVIASAGVDHGVKTEYYEDLDVLEDIYRTNVFAMAYTFHAFIGPMKRRGRGRLVGIGSAGGIRGMAGSDAYCASKSAVITYLESLRIELRRYGILVQTICPGYVKTPLTDGNPYHMPFILTPDEFAERAVKAIDRGDTYRVIPWQMGVLTKILRLLPNALYDRIVENRPQKPRVTRDTVSDK